jgi:hypothetical protein
LVLGPNTDLTVEKNGSSVKIVVRAGYVEFASQEQRSLNFSVAPYQIASNGAAAGLVAAGPEAVGVRAVRGTLTMTNLETKEARILDAASKGTNEAGVVAPRSASAEGTSSSPQGPTPPVVAGGAEAALSTAAIVGIVAAVGVGVTVLAVALKKGSDS